MSKNVKFWIFITYNILVLAIVLIGGVGACTKKIIVITIAIMIIAKKEKIDVA